MTTIPPSSLTARGFVCLLCSAMSPSPCFRLPSASCRRRQPCKHPMWKCPVIQISNCAFFYLVKRRVFKTPMNPKKNLPFFKFFFGTFDKYQTEKKYIIRRPLGHRRVRGCHGCSKAPIGWFLNHPRGMFTSHALPWTPCSPDLQKHSSQQGFSGKSQFRVGQKRLVLEG